jgi:DNA (cytosine-5)-methyltransferase 1
VRALTLKEYALIQEFPKDWELCGTPSEQYVQVGNAVPVRLGRVAGEVLAKELDALRARRWRPLAEKPVAYRIIYVQSHVRTRQWFKGGKTFVWEDGCDNTDANYEAPQTLRKVSAIV